MSVAESLVGARMFFLTEVDPNAKVKGSRDPLGMLSVWSSFGRRVVGNLTTQTTAFDDFRVLLLGAWLTDQVQVAGRTSVGAAYAFMAWEQLASYSRWLIGRQGGFRGITRVQRNSAENEILISGDRDAQILNSQSSYGIWGLYRAAAWRCGLLHRATPMVRGDAEEVVRQVYLPRLEEAWGQQAHQLLTWVEGRHLLQPGTKDHRLKLEAVNRCIGGRLSAVERRLFRATLVDGGVTGAGDAGALAAPDVRVRQRELALLLAGLTEPRIGRGAVRDLTRRAGGDLAERLRDIVALESVLAPTAAIFSYLTTLVDNPAKSEVTRSLDQHFESIPHLVDADDIERLDDLYVTQGLLKARPDERGAGRDRWVQIAQALGAKNFDLLIELLITQTELVSRDRGGSVGWLTKTAAERIKPMQIDHTFTALPAQEELREVWVNPYFLPELRTMATAVLTPAELRGD